MKVDKPSTGMMFMFAVLHSIGVRNLRCNI